MTKLHEVLAVDKDKEHQTKAIIAETMNTFKKAKEYFMGSIKTLQMFNDEDQMAADALVEERPITTSVPERLSYTTDFIIDLIDVQMQKESTNQHATGDIVMEDGTVVATNIPATMLLGLERTLAQYRQIFTAIPTLASDTEWVPDTDKGDNIFKSKQPIKTLRTQRSFDIITLAEPTKEHKAQVEKVVIEKPVGTWTTTVWSGMITSNRKAQMLKRFDELTQAVKKSRMRANEQEVSKEKIGKALFSYIAAA